jgi:hypothetical protein
MYTKGFGELLAFALTVNPSIGAISSASAILDTSNYTFAAVTLGKDAEGFKHHAHTIYSLSAGVYNSGVVVVKAYNSSSPSSYHVSATHLALSSTYNSIPAYPDPNHRRLEIKSTSTNSPVADFDLGHYINAAISPSLQPYWNIIGGFAPSGGTAAYHFYNSSGNYSFSGILSGMFNSIGVVDEKGFIKINQGSALTATFADSVSAGPYIFIRPTFSSIPEIGLVIALQYGDGASIEAFGGLNHIGIWTIDMEEMLKIGLKPPYTFSNVNNSIKYKLVAKVTSWKDILHHEDAIDASIKILYDFNSKSYSGFKTLLQEGFNDFTPTGSKGIGIILDFKFT